MKKRFTAVLICVGLIAACFSGAYAQETETDTEGAVNIAEDIIVLEDSPEEAAGEEESVSEEADGGVLILPDRDAAAEEPAELPDGGAFPEEAEMFTQGDGTIDEGWCGNDLYYVLDGSGRLDITGTGTVWNCYNESDPNHPNQPWASYSDMIWEVYFSKGVTGIGACAFQGCKNLVHLYLPSTLKNIDNTAFSRCINLKEVDLPDTTTKIGNFAFEYCNRLERVSGGGVKVIGTGAFADCYSLESAVMRNAYQIGSQAFLNCSSLACAEFATTRPSTSVTPVIGLNAFFECSALEEFYCPYGMKLIDLGTFQGCSSLKCISIPSTVTMIDMNAFRDCSALADIQFRGTKTQWNKIQIGEYNDGLENYFLTIHYKDETQTVKLDRSSLNLLAKDGSTTLIATVSPAGAYPGVRWTSSDPSVATVSPKGEVTALFYGKTTITVETLSSGSKATCAVKVDFLDVPNTHTYYNAVCWGADKGITSGYRETGTFGVNDNCTRGQFMMFLWRAAGKPAPKVTNKAYFDDVPKTHTFFKAVQWAYEKEITKGKSSTLFGVNDTCTRGEAMVFLWRSKGKPAPKAGVSVKFTDMPSNATFQKAIKWGASYKITNGYDNGNGTRRFEPDAYCTRGHIMFFLYKARNL